MISCGPKFCIIPEMQGIAIITWNLYLVYPACKFSVCTMCYRYGTGIRTTDTLLSAIPMFIRLSLICDYHSAYHHCKEPGYKPVGQWSRSFACGILQLRPLETVCL